MFHEFGKEGVGHGGQSHRGARVAGVRLLHRVHREDANGVYGEFGDVFSLQIQDNLLCRVPFARTLLLSPPKAYAYETGPEDWPGSLFPKRSRRVLTRHSPSREPAKPAMAQETIVVSCEASERPLARLAGLLFEDLLILLRGEEVAFGRDAQSDH